MPIDRGLAESATPPGVPHGTADGVPPAAAGTVAVIASMTVAVAIATARRILAASAAPNRAARIAAELTAELSRIFATAERSAGRAAAAAVRAAYLRGAGQARRDLKFRAALRGDDRRAAVVAAEIQRVLAATRPHVLRWARTGYRDATGAAARGGLPAADAVWARGLARGVTGMTDRHGRNWELTGYIEQAVRTAMMAAAIRGHLDVMAAAGHDLMIVTAVSADCLVCARWRGQILAVTGPPGPRTITIADPQQPDRHIRLHVAGTVAEAARAGLWHPNCRHQAWPYVPGVTAVPRHRQEKAAQAASRRARRYLARRTRTWELRARASLTAPARRRAAQRAREMRAELGGLATP